MTRGCFPLRYRVANVLAKCICSELAVYNHSVRLQGRNSDNGRTGSVKSEWRSQVEENYVLETLESAPFPLSLPLKPVKR